MALIRARYPFRKKRGPCVLTWGNFDGVHCGHQVLLNALVSESRKQQYPSLVITFFPLPSIFFRKPFRVIPLMRLKEKYSKIIGYGVDDYMSLFFNQDLANLAPELFVRNILVNQCQAKTIIIGHDCSFGKNRMGDVLLLKQLGRSFGFTVIEVPAICYLGLRISSSRIRTTLARGEMMLAKHLLGRWYSVEGRVVQGQQLGRALGFPTANLHVPGQEVLPLSGVFVVYATVAGRRYPAVANVGTRPTVLEHGKTVCEVHLLKGDFNLYGQWLTVEFIHRLRDEHHYSSSEALIAQMHADVAAAKQYF